MKVLSNLDKPFKNYDNLQMIPYNGSSATRPPAPECPTPLPTAPRQPVPLPHPSGFLTGKATKGLKMGEPHNIFHKIRAAY